MLTPLYKYRVFNDLLAKGIKYLDLVVTSHCNLNCRYCSTLSPLSEPYFIELENFKKNIKRLAEIIPSDKIENIHIVGGEPLLHPDISSFFKYVRSSFPLNQIFLFTNGLLLNKMNEVFKKELKENKINIRISHYPNTINLDKTLKDYTDYGIDIEIYEKEFFYRYQFDLTGQQNTQRNLESCKYYGCIGLIENKLYLCSRDFFIRKNLKPFLKTTLSVEDGGEDIFKNKDYFEILSNLVKKFPLDSCRFCKFPVYSEKWQRSKDAVFEYLK